MKAFARSDKKSHLSARAQWRVLSNYLGMTCTVLLHRQGDVTRDDCYIVPTLQRCVALKVVIANCLV